MRRMGAPSSGEGGLRYWPPWLQYRIFSSLSARDLASCACTCKAFRAESEDALDIWRNAVFKEIVGYSYATITSSDDLRSRFKQLIRMVAAIDQSVDYQEAQASGEVLSSKLPFVIDLWGAVSGTWPDKGRQMNVRYWRSYLNTFYSKRSNILWPYIIRLSLLKLKLSKLMGTYKLRWRFTRSQDEEAEHVLPSPLACIDGRFPIFSTSLVVQTTSRPSLPREMTDSLGLLDWSASDLIDSNASPPSVSLSISLDGEGKWVELMSSEGHRFLSYFEDPTHVVQLTREGHIPTTTFDSFDFDTECTGFNFAAEMSWTAYCHFLEVPPALVCDHEVCYTHLSRGSCRRALQSAQEVTICFSFGQLQHAVDLQRIQNSSIVRKKALKFRNHELKDYSLTLNEMKYWMNYVLEESSDGREVWPGMDLCIIVGKALVLGRSTMEKRCVFPSFLVSSLPRALY